MLLFIVGSFRPFRTEILKKMSKTSMARPSKRHGRGDVQDNAGSTGFFIESLCKSCLFVPAAPGNGNDLSECLLTLLPHPGVGGLALAWVPLIWAAASAVKAVVAAPAGMLSDRFGRLPVLLSGWSLRCVLLIVLAMTTNGAGSLVTWVLFLGYAGPLAATEGAPIGDSTPDSERGTAFGIYHMTAGLAALPGVLLFGGIWQLWGSAAAFLQGPLLSGFGLDANFDPPALDPISTP